MLAKAQGTPRRTNEFFFASFAPLRETCFFPGF
jgi:hypothetical protein